MYFLAMFKGFLWIAGGLFVVIYGYLCWIDSQRNKRAQELEELAERKSRKYRGMPSVRGDGLVLMMHPRDRTAMIVLADGRTKELPFSAFQDAQINEDGNTVFDTKRQGVLGRAAIGGVISGGAGAVIGALTARQITSPREIVTRISIDVTTNDPEFAFLSWITFAPVVGVSQMQPAEVMIQRQNAVSFYNQLAPIFAPSD